MNKKSKITIDPSIYDRIPNKRKILGKCEQCGNDATIRHHTRYKELHGTDSTILLCGSCHRNLHINLRKTGKCTIPPKELEIISNNAHDRLPEVKKRHSEYDKKHRRGFIFTDNMIHNVSHYEHVKYNTSTEHISVNCYFRPNHGKELYFIDI